MKRKNRNYNYYDGPAFIGKKPRVSATVSAKEQRALSVLNRTMEMRYKDSIIGITSVLPLSNATQWTGTRIMPAALTYFSLLQGISYFGVCFVATQ